MNISSIYFNNLSLDKNKYDEEIMQKIYYKDLATLEQEIIDNKNDEKDDDSRVETYP